MMDSLLQRMAREQGQSLTEEELGLMQAAQRPTNTQMALQQILNPQPVQPQMLPQDMMLAANKADPYGGVSTQTRKAMDEMGRADPTGEFGDAIINKQPSTPSGYAAKTTVRGKQSAAQEEQLVRMLMGRGMSREEALKRARSF